MPAHTVVTEFMFEVGDTVFFVTPRTATAVAYKETTVQQATVIGKRVTINPETPSSPPAIPGPPFQTIIQYDIRFFSGLTRTVLQSELLNGTEDISTVV
jgi:hypothetical protein